MGSVCLHDPRAPPAVVGDDVNDMHAASWTRDVTHTQSWLYGVEHRIDPARGETRARAETRRRARRRRAKVRAGVSDDSNACSTSIARSTATSIESI